MLAINSSSLNVEYEQHLLLKPYQIPMTHMETHIMSIILTDLLGIPQESVVALGSLFHSSRDLIEFSVVLFIIYFFSKMVLLNNFSSN